MPHAGASSFIDPEVSTTEVSPPSSTSSWDRMSSESIEDKADTKKSGIAEEPPLSEIDEAEEEAAVESEQVESQKSEITEPIIHKFNPEESEAKEETKVVESSKTNKVTEKKNAAHEAVPGKESKEAHKKDEAVSGTESKEDSKAE